MGLGVTVFGAIGVDVSCNAWSAIANGESELREDGLPRPKKEGSDMEVEVVVVVMMMEADGEDVDDGDE